MKIVTRAALALGVVIGAATITPTHASPRPEVVTAAPPIKVAIIPGIAVNLDAARVDALSQDLADALATELDVTAIGGLEVRRALPADGIPPDCVATPACFGDVAQRVGADQLLFVVMVDTGGGAIQIDSTWVEPLTGRSVSRPAIDIASLADAKSRFLSVAPTLLPDARHRPGPALGGTTSPKTQMSDEIGRHVTLSSTITAGVTVVGLGVGIGFGLATRGKFNACEDTPATCDADERDSIRTTGILADAGYLVAIGGAIATVVLYATSGRPSRLIIAPTEDGGGMASWSGSFW